MSNDNFKGSRMTPMQLAALYSKSDYFRKGYEEGYKGIPYNYDIAGNRATTAYERGRAFAIWSKSNNLPRAVWRNGVAAKTVQDRLIRAIVQRAVI